MYQVLLVDDEPLILAGIKFMIDWQKNDCQKMCIRDSQYPYCHLYTLSLSACKNRFITRCA